MTEIPETALDYLILSKEQAEAIQKFFDKSYIHYDDSILHEAVNKINSFVDRAVANDNSSLHNGHHLPISIRDDDALASESDVIPYKTD